MPRTRQFAPVVAATLLVIGCAGSSAGGCAGLSPIPGGHYVGPKNDNAVNVRLSANGVNYLNSNWSKLVSMFAPGNTIAIPVPCTPLTGTSSTPIGDVYVADQGNAGGVGRNDAVCDGNDLPANVAINITGMQIVPTPPDKISVSISLGINTGTIYLTNPHGLCDLKCSVDYNSTANLGNTVAATLQLTISQKWDKLLAFNLQPVNSAGDLLNGTQVCGTANAMPAPECFNPSDLTFASQGGFCSLACDAANWGFIKDTVFALLSAPLQSTIAGMIDKQDCAKCTAPDGGAISCPTSTDGTSTQATCTSGLCMDPVAGGKCVPMLLGTEGRLDMGAFLGQFGAPAGSMMDMSLAVGSSVTVDQGISLGTRAGFNPVTVSPCVPPSAAPPLVSVAAPDFDAEATPGSTYHAALGISSGFLNQAFYSAQQSGALCLSLNTSNVGLINTGLFKTFLPSLGKLATRDGKDAPMMVVLRPALPPTVVVGKGTYDPSTLKPIEPLLTISLPQLSIDFYAMLDDRYARLFTISADISLPLSLVFQGCDSVTPALGDLRSLITNIRTANSEMLAEDPAVLADLIPAVVGLAEPAVASALKPFALPTLGQFKLKVNEAKGLSLIAGTTRYNHLGIYAQLMDLNAICATVAPKTVVALKRSVIPLAGEMKLTGHGLPWPQAVLDVQALGKAGTPQFSWKVDEGLWTDFAPAPDGELKVSHPVFLLQGVHTIHVRSRVAEDPHGISGPVSLGFRVDWDAPQVALHEELAQDRLVLTASDVVSPDSALKYAYQLGTGAVSDFGAPREISLSGVETFGSVTAFVRDEAGNVGQATWRAPSVATRPDPAGAVPAAGGTSAGCTTAGGLELLALGLYAALARRKRRS